MLSTITGPMITVASLAFSMTLVALTLAAGNIGPRLINRFMDNQVNQIALGLFLATFVYSLFVLRAITNGDPPFVPELAINLAILSFGWLIYFIHDLARSIQIDDVVAKVAEELAVSFKTLSRRFPDAVAVPVDRDVEGTAVRARSSGYLQAIDADALLDLAVDHDVVIRKRARPGDFVVPSTVVTDIVGPKRTAAQDSAYGIALIVEIAARALSPGVNDFYTALTCIDHLTAALDVGLDAGLPDNGFQDKTGRLRLVLVTADGLMNTAFDPLGQAGCGNIAVTTRLLGCLTQLAENRDGPEILAAIERHGHLVLQAATVRKPADADQQTINDGHAALQKQLRQVSAAYS